MTTKPEWRFVDGDTPGDGALWLENPKQLWGFIDFRDDSESAWNRLMVVARSFAEASIRKIGGEAQWTVLAAMLVVPDGTPEGMRSAIEAAVSGGGLQFFAANFPSAAE